MAISVDMSGIGNAALVIGAVLVVVLIARRVRYRARCRAAARSPLDDIPTPLYEKFGPTVNEAVRLARQRDRRAFMDRFDYYENETVNAAMGAATEEWIGASLESTLPETWDIAHDVLILSEPPATGVSANIDHLLSGPAGLVMVDAKHWIGETVLAEDGRLVRYRGPSRQKSVETCLFEASCLAVLPAEIVIAVDGGTVRDGIIRVPRINPSLPDIPVAVVEWSLVPAYLESMEPDLPIDLDRLIAASPRVVAG
ncbi:nuclease-related domain-containing protein [Corynebacterium bovis]|uniref:nuclease-related domain-containing protein n=1 Tax=Corynebacterium bovis TaxID=36808 RepID=UPI00244BC58B|nr:nuclease-related domain-containing protein [Corynebacterium bovis]MDH2455703.1 nuclease-related domain-containing protein [Corynebacterium bovis]